MTQGPVCTFRVLTLFPEMFPGPLGYSLAGKALENGLWRLETTDFRDFAPERGGRVDDTPFGGGPGMVMRPDVLAAAVESVLAGGVASRGPVVYFSPRGRLLDQALVAEIARAGGATLACGRFEGVDERAIEALAQSHGLIEVSLGDFVLSGGEVGALALIDAVVRTLPGVVGDVASLAEESFSEGLLEYPQYTRPRVWRERAVPEVLLGGDHGAIKAWRRGEAERLTRNRRPDLWARKSDLAARSRATTKVKS